MRIHVLAVIITGLTAAVAFGAFVYFSPPWISPQDRLAEFVRLDKINTSVKDTLEQFLLALHEKRYADAVKLYGGSYETLHQWNPSIDAGDCASLWRNGCEHNGLNCLVVSAMEVGERSTDESYVVNAWLVGADGNEFFVSTHAGDGANEAGSRRNVFPFTVAKSPDGVFRVQTMPVYTP